MTTILTQQQITEYRRKGYVVLRRVFESECVREWRSECNRLLQLEIHDEHNLRTITRPDLTGKNLIERIDPVLDLSPVFQSLSKDERILQPLRELLDDDVMLFKDKIVFKLPGAQGYSMHQDYSWWQRFPRDLINVLVAIDPGDANNGGIELVPGYHNCLLSTAGEVRQMTEDEARQIDPNNVEPLQAEAGDLLIFDCLTPHRSAPNHSNHPRRHLYLTYSSAKHGDLYNAQFEYYKETHFSRSSGNSKQRLFFQ